MGEPITKYSADKEPWLGGEIELNPDSLNIPEFNGSPWRFEACQTVTSARTAIKVVARALKAYSNRIWLLPAYLCSSMLQPFREEGISLDFYKVRGDLTIDLEDLEFQLDALKPTGVLFINYFGFPVRRAEAESLLRLKSRCWVIEDCAQGSLVEREDPVVGGIGHFVVTSFRKYLGVPDGGLLINGTDVPLHGLPPAAGPFVRYRLVGKLLRHECLQGKLVHPELEAAYLALFSEGEKELDSSIPLEAMSPISERLLGMTDFAGVMESRRRNYRFLLKAFAETPQLQTVGTPVLGELPMGVSPLVFPIRVDEQKRDLLRQRLISKQVFCPVHWDLPAEVNEDRFPEAHDLSRHMLGLPLDQRYSEDDMQSLINRLIGAWEDLDRVGTRSVASLPPT